MPYQWSVERERLMLLLAVSSSNLKPSAETWAAVAALLGEGLTPSAVSQKYYKLRKESARLCNGSPILTPPTTPAKRKASTEYDSRFKQETPAKRPKGPIMKEENLDGEQHSVLNSIQEQSELSFHHGYQIPFASEQFSRYGMEQVSIESGEVESSGLWLGHCQERA